MTSGLDAISFWSDVVANAWRVIAFLCWFAVAQPLSAQMQTAATGDDSRECVGVIFGHWTPTLDWNRAGHEAPLPATADARDSTPTVTPSRAIRPKPRSATAQRVTQRFSCFPSGGLQASSSDYSGGAHTMARAAVKPSPSLRSPDPSAR